MIPSPEASRWSASAIIRMVAWLGAAGLAIGMVIAGAVSLSLAGTDVWVETSPNNWTTDGVVPPSAYGALMLVAGLVEMFVLFVLLAIFAPRSVASRTHASAGVEEPRPTHDEYEK